MRFTADTEIAVAAPEAFDYMADARNEPLWNSKVTRSELLSDGPVGVGSRFLTVNRGQEYTATITTFDPPQRVVFEVTGKPMDVTTAFAFSEAGAGRTRLAGDIEMRPKGAMKLMLPLMSPLVRRDFPKQMRAFRALCEGDRVSQPEPR